jgi:glycosyltransferase involved in cell wall biosynthesis
VPDALLQHRLAFNRRFWPTIAAPVGRYAIAIPLASMGFGAWSLVWGQLIGISAEVLLLIVLADWRPRVGWSPAAAGQLLRYSARVGLVEWTAALGFNLDYLLVGHFLGTGVLGLYTLAFKLPDSTIGAVGWVGSRVLLPTLVRSGDNAGNVLVGSLRMIALVLVPVAVLLCLLTPRLVPFVFGDQWLPAVPVVQLLVVSACLNGVSQVIGTAFIAAGQPRKITVAQLAWLGVLVPLLFISAQRDIIAVAVAHVSAMSVYVAVKLALVPGTLHIRLSDIVKPRRQTPRRLRAAMIIQSFYPRIGGAETNLQSLIQPLSQLGVDVEVVTRRFHAFAPTEIVDGARVLRMPACGGQVRASLTFVVSTVFHLVRCRPDIIHAHELRSPVVAAVCGGWILRRPVVAHVLRGGELGDVGVLSRATLGKPRLWLFRLGVSRFVAVSRETRRELLAAHIPQTRITLIPYGVDTERFRPADSSARSALRRQFGFNNCKVVLVVARLVPEKGFDRLLEAWSLVKRRVPDALLVLLGDGPERQLLESLAARLEDVRFVGEVRDPVPYLQAADCLTLPSFTEGQPISLLEAMSTGLVCVGTDIGGISDALDDGRLGVLVPPGNVDCLAEALIEVLELQETQRAGLGEAARREILEHHSIESNAAALRQLYEELV